MNKQIFYDSRFISGQSADRALTKLCERLVFFTPDLLRKSTPEGLRRRSCFFGINTVLVKLALLCVALNLTQCGRYGSPIAPEEVSPSAVQELEVFPELQGVRFAWKSPQTDQRGKELKSIDEYRIYRKTLERDSDLIDDSVEYELVASIEDTHLQIRDERREEALEAGKPTRFIKVEDELMKFEFTDIGLTAGTTYAYQLIPVNQGGVEGAIDKVIRIVFRGPSSDVIIVPVATLEESPFT